MVAAADFPWWSFQEMPIKERAAHVFSKTPCGHFPLFSSYLAYFWTRTSRDQSEHQTHAVNSIAAGAAKAPFFHQIGPYAWRYECNELEEGRLISLDDISFGHRKMCYYEQYIYACNDHKWGNFKAHCSKEYRIGETCGMKFIHRTYALKDECKCCDKIATKGRRLKKQLDDIKRWEKEKGSKKTASIDKAWATVDSLDVEIQQLQYELNAKRMNSIGSGRTTARHYPPPSPAHSQSSSSSSAGDHSSYSY